MKKITIIVLIIALLIATKLLSIHVIGSHKENLIVYSKDHIIEKELNDIKGLELLPEIDSSVYTSDSLTYSEFQSLIVILENTKIDTITIVEKSSRTYMTRFKKDIAHSIIDVLRDNKIKSLCLQTNRKYLLIDFYDGIIPIKKKEEIFQKTDTTDLVEPCNSAEVLLERKFMHEIDTMIGSLLKRSIDSTRYHQSKIQAKKKNEAVDFDITHDSIVNKYIVNDKAVLVQRDDIESNKLAFEFYRRFHLKGIVYKYMKGDESFSPTRYGRD